MCVFGPFRLSRAQADELCRINNLRPPQIATGLPNPTRNGGFHPSSVIERDPSLIFDMGWGGGGSGRTHLICRTAVVYVEETE